MCDYDAIKKAIKPNTKIFFSESPTNPYLNIMDLERLMRIFKGKDILVISDSTFATPYNQRPLEYGIDIVTHSATKYLGGHNDLMSGVVLAKKKLTDVVREYLKITGGVIDPHSSYLLIRGLKTFEIRMQRHNENGQIVAEFLERHPKVKKVYYPGLRSHPHYKIAKKQMKGFGGVVTFEVEDNVAYALKFMSRLKIICIGPSLGGVESLITHPATVSYYAVSRKERLALGIKDGLIRLAVGIENAEDIIEDLKQALR
jgi:cystathionine gamma-synthase